MLFYVLAVLIRVVSTRFETIDPSHVKLWDFVGGLSPLIGAIVVIFALRRKMKTSLFGTSVTKSILTLAVPFGLFGIVDYKEIGLCLWLLSCFPILRHPRPILWSVRYSSLKTCYFLASFCNTMSYNSFCLLSICKITDFVRWLLGIL